LLKRNSWSEILEIHGQHQKQLFSDILHIGTKKLQTWSEINQTLNISLLLLKRNSWSEILEIHGQFFFTAY
jgi:hypothetical protein